MNLHGTKSTAGDLAFRPGDLHVCTLKSVGILIEIVMASVITGRKMAFQIIAIMENTPDLDEAPFDRTIKKKMPRTVHSTGGSRDAMTAETQVIDAYVPGEFGLLKRSRSGRIVGYVSECLPKERLVALSSSLAKVFLAPLQGFPNITSCLRGDDNPD